MSLASPWAAQAPGILQCLPPAAALRNGTYESASWNTSLVFWIHTKAHQQRASTSASQTR